MERVAPPGSEQERKSGCPGALPAELVGPTEQVTRCHAVAATVSPCEVRAPGTVARRDLLVHLDIGEVVADERSTYRPDQLFDRSHVGCLGPPRVKRRRTCSVSAVPRLARAGGARADGMIQFCPARLATHA
ncbi:hypothetical protein Saso_75340 [Streptomyces asoensis]|uniref:Uncharacterized protein n=1 Tax=Streptomyces asoensis TaxID=249586 RepID=A0ABQ3SCM9_9ACTN|nr:hypothetical protein GCM10010496_64570 [Streptomyces asoensis]GHI65884.1 hypothetical protein Saso_75340 [Streptomyces asoensis]